MSHRIPIYTDDLRIAREANGTPWFFWLCLCLAIFPSIRDLPAVEVEKTVRFNRDVLPILAENCFACHGFDPESREADLRLDLREDALKERNAGTVVVPGKPELSLLIERITTKDQDLVMPPAESDKHLSPQQIAILRAWIAQGAEYENHWSFNLPIRTEPPKINNTEHPIDRFVQSKLAESGLGPSREADLTTLIRRVSLDLIGIPPLPNEIDEFETASRIDKEKAYRDLIERLLASPHYGERWGRWWLDQARYADSNGYSIDAPRQIWKYRDWVVEAFNNDLPFDQFTVEQLAGDLLPEATVSEKLRPVSIGTHRSIKKEELTKNNFESIASLIESQPPGRFGWG